MNRYPISRPAWIVFVVTICLWITLCRARADFSGPYVVPDPGNYPLVGLPPVIPVGTWTLLHYGAPLNYGNSHVFTSAPRVSIDTGVSASHNFGDSLIIEFTNTIVADGMLSFDYSLMLRATGIFQIYNYGGYTLNGSLIQLPSGTGSVDVPVNAGDEFGFLAYAGPNCVLCDPSWAAQTTMTITNFSAPVPEPATTLLLLPGLAGLTFIRRSRRLL